MWGREAPEWGHPPRPARGSGPVNGLLALPSASTPDNTLQFLLNLVGAGIGAVLPVPSKLDAQSSYVGAVTVLAYRQVLLRRFRGRSVRYRPGNGLPGCSGHQESTTSGTVPTAVGLAIVAGAVSVNDEPEVCASTLSAASIPADALACTVAPMSVGTDVALTMIAA